MLSNTTPRRWEFRAVDGTVLDQIATDANVSLLPYGNRLVLLVPTTGTSLFDLVSRQQRLITATQVVPAEWPTLIGRTCQAERCTVTVIDSETGSERVLVPDLSINDAINATLSPDGRYLATTRKSRQNRPTRADH